MIDFFKKKWIFLAAIMVAVTLLPGCVQSKEGYQNRMTKILADTRSELEDITKKPENNAKIVDKQIDVLKKTKAKIESIAPPDDFFLGHADILQFLDFSIEGMEFDKKTGAKGRSEKDSQELQLSPEQTDALKMKMAANRSLGRAVRELPFLEFDLLETFGQLAGGGPGIGSPTPIPSQPRRITPQQPQQ